MFRILRVLCYLHTSYVNMCGITATYSAQPQTPLNAKTLENQLRASIKMLHHRGPDSSGIYMSDDYRVGRRILDCASSLTIMFYQGWATHAYPSSILRADTNHSTIRRTKSMSSSTANYTTTCACGTIWKRKDAYSKPIPIQSWSFICV